MNHNVTQTLKIEAMSGDMSIQEITRRLESVGVLVSDMTINPILRETELEHDPCRKTWAEIINAPASNL